MRNELKIHKSMIFRHILVVSTIFTEPLSAEQEEDAPLQNNTDMADEKGWEYSFFSSQGYRFGYATAPEEPSVDVQTGDVDAVSGATGPTVDHELRFYLNQSITSPNDSFYSDVSMALFVEAYHTETNGIVNPYQSIYENGESGAWFDVYNLTAEYRSNSGTLAHLRGGRQTTEHGPQAVFDGLSTEIRLAKPYLDLFAFGGRTVYFFDLDSEVFDNWIGSGGLVIRPHPMLKFELDYRFISENVADSIDGAERINESSYGLSGWTRIGNVFFINAYGRGLYDKIAHVGGSVNLDWAEAGVGMSAGADAQTVAIHRINEMENPYYQVLGESLPHARVHADLWKIFNTKSGDYSISTGWNGRILTYGEPTFFNRDYGRVYLWLQVSDFILKGPFFGATAEYHYTLRNEEGGKDSTFAAGGSGGYEGKVVRMEVGTYYQRYKYKYYIDISELEKARTYYGELGFDIGNWLMIRLKYELEIYDRVGHVGMITLSEKY